MHIYTNAHTLNTGLVYLSVYRVYYLSIIGGLQIGVPPRRPLDCARFKRHIIRPDHLCVYTYMITTTRVYVCVHVWCFTRTHMHLSVPPSP